MSDPASDTPTGGWAWLRDQAVTAAIVGLAAAAAGSILQGKYSVDVEKRRAESELIVQALQANDQGEALKRLRFHKRLGLITVVDDKTLDALTPAQLPLRTVDGELSGVALKYPPDRRGGLIFGVGAIEDARHAQQDSNQKLGD